MSMSFISYSPSRSDSTQKQVGQRLLQKLPSLSCRKNQRIKVVTLTPVLEDQPQCIGIIVRLQRQFVGVLGALQDLGQRGQADPQRDIAVASVVFEFVGFEFYGDEGYVGVVHRLEGLWGDGD
jgi:hypothetical protein